MDASAARPLLSLRGVGRRYPDGTEALAGLDLDLGANEVLALLGPSGCGKSTALRLVAGLEAPTQGTLAWQGDAAPPLGFVFQEPTLMPWASVADNVYLPLRLQGLSRAAAAPRVDAALQGVGLASRAGALPRELSGGMKMRVSIARALVTRPRLLLLDEPFAALDEMTREQLGWDLLALRAAQGFAVLFVTHSVAEAVVLADRVVVLAARPGRAVAELRIDAAAPRDAAYRGSAAYAAQCQAVSAALRRTLAGAPLAP